MPSASEPTLAPVLRLLTLLGGAMLALAGAALAGAPAPAAAHPSHVVEPVTVDDLGYSPASVTILQGRSVQWLWESSAARSVTSGPGSALQFDSGLRKSGDRSFVYRFDEPGTFHYFSKAGYPRIEGTIEVLPLPGVAPRIKRLRAHGGHNPKARFRLNKPAYLVARVQQRKGGRWRTRKSVSRNGHKGGNRIGLGRKLHRGRYRLRLTAYDRYRRKDTAGTRFRVR